MVTIEKQFEVACQLARESEHARIAFVCSLFTFHELGRLSLISDCVFKLHNAEMVFPSGGVVRWVKNNAEDVVELYCGHQFTSVFFTDNIMAWKGQEYLISRLRSSKHPGLLKAYYPSGLAVWKESEQYGG